MSNTSNTPTTVTIDGVTYRRDATPSVSSIVRTRDAGVFAGEIVRRDGEEVQMTGARRLWFWSGAASLSQLALEGVKRPKECKFPAPVDVVLRGVIEILPMTQEAVASVASVPEWSV